MPGMTDREHLAAAALAGRFTDFAAFEIADAMLRERAKTNHDAAPEPIANAESVAPQPTAGDRAGSPPSHSGTGDTPDSPKPIKGGVSDSSKPINGPTPVHTPPAHTTRGEGSEQRECTEPVAWAVMPSNSDYCVTLSTRKEAAKKAAERKVEVGEYATMDDIVIVPLYRHPPCQDLSRKNLTLTDAEREAVRTAADAYAVRGSADGRESVNAATLRGLLERLGGCE